MFYLLNRASKSQTVFTIGFLASRSSKLDPMLIGFDELFFHEKNRTKKPNREHGFFPFRKRHARASREITTVPLVEAEPWLSWKEKKTDFFLFCTLPTHTSSGLEHHFLFRSVIIVGIDLHLRLEPYAFLPIQRNVLVLLSCNCNREETVISLLCRESPLAHFIT